MSTIKESFNAITPSQKVSKKRKMEGADSEKSKKKRKHVEPQEDAVPSQEPSEQPMKKEKKEKKSKKEKVDESSKSEKSEKKAKKKNRSEDREQTVTENEAPETFVEEDFTLPDVLSGQTAVADDVIGELDQMEGIQQDLVEEIDKSIYASQDPTCFYTKRMSFYVPLPAISLASPESSLLSAHLAPLLLTYYPPAGGVVVSFSDPVLSAQPESGVNLPLRPPTSGRIPTNPPTETFAQCADQFGVSWVWLTATLLVFSPRQGDKLKAWTNVQSESFIGLVSYNYFQTSVGKERISKSWTFDGPTREQRSKKKTHKGKLKYDSGEDLDGELEPSQQSERSDHAEVGAGDGVFVDENSSKIQSNQTITVAGVEMVPGSERNTFGMQIEGSLLSAEEEKAVLEEERRRYEAAQKRLFSPQIPGAGDGDLPLMSGALSLSREASIF